MKRLHKLPLDFCSHFICSKQSLSEILFSCAATEQFFTSSLKVRDFKQSIILSYDIHGKGENSYPVHL